MSIIIQVLVNAAIILGLAYMLPKIQVRNYGTAIIAAIVIGVLNYLIGWVLRVPLNLLTLGLFSTVISIVVTALMIKATDKLMGGFNIQGFMPAVVIAVVTALVNHLIASM